ncbi:MAG: MBL fold metallo-hydrolase [Bacteroidia bacterium]|jgi:glyoxylase-like metal-dependent hydrolase (beta-lactamase superfamily II)|nr:MBL fold metallo-hydrolase [Bacteroidia bacterium]
MLYLKSFCFNPFQQNTYVLYNERGAAFIIDPGNSTHTENEVLSGFIEEKNLKPERLLLTHAHLDHVLGNRFVFDKYGLLPEVHPEDEFFIERMGQSAAMYGVPFEQSPMPKEFLKHGQLISLGAYELECIHSPGHSPGSISFFIKDQKILISGDVLFRESIGRSDLPKGNHATLLESIQSRIFPLGDDIKVFSGHGPSTTIAHERSHNPFLT